MCLKSVSIKPSRCKQISLLIITYSTMSTKEDSQMLQDILKKIIDFLFQVFVTGNKVCFGVLVCIKEREWSRLDLFSGNKVRM